MTTIAGLLDNALLKNDELRQILQSVGKFCVRFILQRFKTKFKSLCKISKASMSVVTILVTGKINPDKTRAAVKYAGSRFKRELLRELTSVSKSGEVPALDVSFNMMVLTDLPGIAELLSTTGKADVDEHWKAMEDFVVGSICHVKDVKRKLEGVEAATVHSIGRVLWQTDGRPRRHASWFQQSIRHMHQLAWLTHGHRRRFSENSKVPQKVPRVSTICLCRSHFQSYE